VETKTGPKPVRQNSASLNRNVTSLPINYAIISVGSLKRLNVLYVRLSTFKQGSDCILTFRAMLSYLNDLDQGCSNF